MTCHSYYRLYVRAREAINGIMRQDVSCVMNITVLHRGAGAPVKYKQNFAESLLSINMRCATSSLPLTERIFIQRREA
jgi:hypothetical protein